MHWYEGVRDDFYDQLLSEIKIPGLRNPARRTWKKRTDRRNEALDCTVYAVYLYRHMRLHLRRPKQWDLADMLMRQAQLIIDAARTRKLPAMFAEPASVAAGGLASYGPSHYAGGRLAAKYVHRVLQGTNPADLPVEMSERFELVINLKTAKALGLTIPQSVLGRADEIIQ